MILRYAEITYYAGLFFLLSLTTALSGNRFGVPMAIVIQMILSIRLIRDLKPSIGFPVLFVLESIIFTLANFGVVPGHNLLLPFAVFSAYVFLRLLLMLLDRYFSKRIPDGLKPLMFPALYTATMFIFMFINPYGTWDVSAYGLNLELSPIMAQSASLGGLWIIHFLLAWTASVINSLWEFLRIVKSKEQGNTIKNLKVPAYIIFWGGCILILTLFGSIWFISGSQNDDTSNTVLVAGITPEVTYHGTYEGYYSEGHDFYRAIRNNDVDPHISNERISDNIDQLFTDSEQAAKAGAKIIVWAEVAASLPYSEELSVIRRGAELCQKYNVYLGLSFNTWLLEPEMRRNSKILHNHLVILGPDGSILADYDKQKPVPGGESENAIKGTETIPKIETPWGDIAFAICFDADFPGIIRQGYGAGLIIITGADWPEISPTHSIMSAWRGIENGSALFRIAQGGQSTAFDKCGSTIAELPLQEGASVFYAHMPINHRPTLYGIAKNWFPWLMIFLTVALIAMGLIRKNQYQ
ncbi:MAG: hypothetical protein JEY91_05365 [Spirochaetaceae bacterium]|nr:hypothetical protein [Spirochaetaceae bacterium]